MFNDGVERGTSLYELGAQCHPNSFHRRRIDQNPGVISYLLKNANISTAGIHSNIPTGAVLLPLSLNSTKFIGPLTQTRAVGGVFEEGS